MMYQTLPNAYPRTGVSFNYGNHQLYGLRSSPPSTNVQGSADIQRMSINLEFGSNLVHRPQNQPGSHTNVPVHGEFMRFNLQCDQPNYHCTANAHHHATGGHHCCCHHHMQLPSNTRHATTMKLQPPSMQHFRGYVHPPCVPGHPQHPTPKFHHAPSTESSTVNLANININIGGFPSFSDHAMPLSKTHQRNASYSDKNAWNDTNPKFQPRVLSGYEIVGPDKPTSRSHEYLNSLNAITRSHDEWHSYTKAGSFPYANTNSPFSPVCTRADSDCPWLPSDLDDEDFRLSNIFLQKSKHPMCVS